MIPPKKEWLEAFKKRLDEMPVEEFMEHLRACGGDGEPTIAEFSAKLQINHARSPESNASSGYLGEICRTWSDDRFLVDVIVKSMVDDVYIQVGKHCAVVIKGKFYKEPEGRIAQLKALGRGKIEIKGQTYRIKSAAVSEGFPIKYDLVLIADNDGQERLDLTVVYAAVRKMVERKTNVLDLDEDHGLLIALNDMHEGTFTFEGKEFHLNGEEWTRSKPGHRDVRVFAAGDYKDQRVITLSEDFIRDMIKTGSTSFDMPKA